LSTASNLPLTPEKRDVFERVTLLDEAWRGRSAGERLDAVLAAAPKLRERIGASGTVAGVRTFDVSDLPYPTLFAFGGAARSVVPYVVMTNRVNIVRFKSRDGMKTLLFNPTDAGRSAETPFFASLRNRMGKTLSTWLTRALTQPTPIDRLAEVGLKPEDVDYIAFDHLHTQDVRGLLGTTTGITASLPNAKLLVLESELDILRSLHPLQAMWFVRDAVRDVPADRIVRLDGDYLLGEGVALVRTPGHTVGNWSLALSTSTGIWTVSENGVATDSYAPLASKIAGLRAYARSTGLELVLNSNTLEGRNEQYTSMMLERALVDRSREAPEFFQHLPSSELKATPITPGLSPTHRFGGVSSGVISRGA
jgi:hypothetical protein